MLKELPNTLYWWSEILCFVVTQILIVIFSIIVPCIKNNGKIKKIKEQISCCKREIWSIQREITSIVVSGDMSIINSEYVKQKVKRLQELKQEIQDLNKQLKDKDKDTTKLNVTETIDMINNLTKKLKGAE